VSALSLTASWLSLLTLAAGVANLSLLWIVRRYRERPGGRWFVALAGLMAAVCFSYGLGLVVFEPLSLRYGLEILFWSAGSWAGFSWFAFALSYTGRGRWLRTAPGLGVGAAVVALSAFLVTNPYHGLFWTGFRVDPVYGAATVSYARGVGLVVGFALIAVLIGASLVVLLETVVSYGRLFRIQTLALALTPVLPTAALVAYVFELGPVPRLNVLPLTLVPHILLDAYALFGGDMFEFDPATRRIGERTAIGDVDTPLVVVDDEGRIITFNDAARTLLDADGRTVVGDALDRHLSSDVDLDRGEQDLELLEDGERRHYRVTTSQFEDATGTRLGHAVSFQDVTDIVQRERHFEVLNRVLRHNLRNDLMVVSGHAEQLEYRLDDADLEASASIIVDESRQLLDLADRARELDKTVRGATDDDDPIPLQSLIERRAAAIQDSYPDAAVEVDVPPALEVRADSELLGLVVRNLLENAIEHNECADPTATVRAGASKTDGRSAWLEITDDGPGIPEGEVAVIEDGTETSLEHGSGLGLWVVQSGVTAIGGDISFSADEAGGTTVRLRIPGLVDDARATASAE